MGISIRCDHLSISTSYGSFNDIRRLIWKHISGLLLDEMEGYTEKGGIPFTGKYRLEYLINHADSCGEITPDQALAMIPELNKLIEDIKYIESPLHLEGRIHYLNKLLMIFEHSAVYNIPIEFG